MVLYFYPKDDTPGCTTEACGFRDALPDFKKLKAQVIGVSKDSVARHDKFKAKYELNFPLASDEDGKVCEKYGTWVEKSLYGRKYMGSNTLNQATTPPSGEGDDAVRHVRGCSWRSLRSSGVSTSITDLTVSTPPSIIRRPVADELIDRSGHRHRDHRARQRVRRRYVR